MTLVNKTAHAVVIKDVLGRTVIIDSSPPPVRISVRPGRLLSIANPGIPIYGPQEYLGLENVPEKEQGVMYIVSQLAAYFIRINMPDRNDFFYPGSGKNDGAVRVGGKTKHVMRLYRAT